MSVQKFVTVDFLSPTEGRFFKICIIIKPYINMTIKFLRRRTKWMRVGIFIVVAITFDGPMYANVESDPVRSGGCPHIKIHTTTLLCISAHLAKSWVWKLILWGVNTKTLVFAASNVTNVMRNCEKPTRTWTQSPANSDVTSRDIFYNLLEFWTTVIAKALA